MTVLGLPWSLIPIGVRMHKVAVGAVDRLWDFPGRSPSVCSRIAQ